MTVALLVILLVVVLALWWRDHRYLSWRVAQAEWQTRVEKAHRCRSQRKHTRYM